MQQSAKVVSGLQSGSNILRQLNGERHAFRTFTGWIRQANTIS